MKKFPALFLMILLLATYVPNVNAQDSVKKVKPAKLTAAKPTPSKYPIYKYKAKNYYKPYRKLVDSNGHAIQAAHPVDTTKRTVIQPDVASDKSLNGQYQYLLTKVYYYQQPLLNAYHKSVMDSLTQARQTLKAVQGKLSVQSKTVDSLQNSIKSNSESLSESNSKRDAISFLGIDMPKSTYNLIMWGLVILFGVIAAIVIARTGAAGREARYRTQLYNELEEEYKTYKVKANEKEKKLARELQTERNRIDDLLGNNNS